MDSEYHVIESQTTARQSKNTPERFVFLSELRSHANDCFFMNKCTV